MRNKSDNLQTFTRRALILGAGKGLLLGTILGRMTYLQLFEGDHYKNLANGNRIRLDLLAPNRGNIIDCNGVTLASNHKSFKAVILNDKSFDSQEITERISKLLDADQTFKDTLIKKLESSPKYSFVIVKDNLTWEEVSRIEMYQAELPIVTVEQGSCRFYPYAQATAHLLGYVQTANEQEALENRLLKVPGFKVGKAGIEKQFETHLRGQAGIRKVEINAKRKVVREIGVTSPIQGAKLQLTINADLQTHIAERLGREKSGCAIVMNVNDGSVLSLVSTPSFDTNLMVKGIDRANWENILHNPYNSLLNKATSGEYAPGSIFKTIVALAALEKGIINKNSSFFCRGYIELGNHRFHCHNKNGHGALNIERSMATSCDIAFYEIAQRLGIDAIAEMARLFGMGSKTGIEIPGEKNGLVPDKEWKKKKFKQKWTLGESYNAGIGQGYLLATPLQITTLMSRIANGGHLVLPRIATGNLESNHDHLGISKSSIDLVKQSLFAVMNSTEGTGYKSGIHHIPDFKLAGKTSSSQVKRISMKDREKGLHRGKGRMWIEREHALYSGFAPFDNPKYAVTVVVEHGEWGGAVAAPIAKNIFEYLYNAKI